MNDVIGGYRLLTPMQTAGSGSARWCMTMRGGERFFLKEFLSPVYPANPHTPIGQKQLERCIRFEQKKQRLYRAASCVLGDVLVPVVDFFRENGHYYAVSEALPENCQTAQQAVQLSKAEKKKLICELAMCMQRIHAQGIVHADLKPEHVLLFPQQNTWKPRLIDLDSGFLTDEPPRTEKEIEGDPAYLAPEAFLCMAGETARLGPKADTFALGAIIHQIWSGEMPEFDRRRYHYLYEAALDHAPIRLELPQEWQETVGRMLRAKPEERPEDAEITALFAAEYRAQSVRANNSLSRLMKG